MKKVISTSLFGNRQSAYYKYALGAPRNAKFVSENMPDWRFRLYFDDTAPLDIIKSVESIKNTECIKMPKGKGREGCFWRFLALDDCDVAVCRDLDFKIQQNDIICINEWLSTDYSLHFIWLVHNRLSAWKRKNRRYYMAGGFGGRKLPFKISDLINKYQDPLSEFGADEYFLTEYLVPKTLEYENKILMHIEPNPKDIPKGQTKEYIELFTNKEEYLYLKENWKGI
tara:strand:+ start:3502 stop:4182 length:681 start_codon:yes stop_codon:yes gene_type:complete